jgi:putative FmdB family regulatory protein
MPTYEYKCENCSHQFEKFESITANPSRKCPNCSKLKLRRLIGSGAGVIFKGNGFYETDYRSESYKKDAEKEKPKTDSDNKKDTQKETKPAESKPENTKKSSTDKKNDK